MNETKHKKMVSRNVAVAMGIICVVLVGSLAYFVVADNSSINNLQNQVNSLQSQVKNLNNITELSDSSVWFENYTSNVNGLIGSNYYTVVSYAGYLILGASSTSNDTWLSVTYSRDLPKLGQWNYDDSINVSSSQTWHAFPILPSNIRDNKYVMLIWGLWNASESANVTLSATFYY